MNTELYLLFLFTTLMLIIVPGPSAITAARQGMANSHKLSFLCALGVACGDAVFFALSATGLASLIVASNWVFQIIKWLGIGYLVYLGLTAFFSKSVSLPNQAGTTNKQAGKAFSKGLVIQLSNPKALMYFSALLPQFIDPNQAIAPQMLLMGITCFLADLLVYFLFGKMGAQLGKGHVKPWALKLINKTAGTTLLATAVRMVTLKAS